MKHTKRTIVIDSAQFAQVIHLASLGITTKEIAWRVGLSESQVSYRIGIHRLVVGLDEGLRHAWRWGNSPWFERVVNDTAAIAEKEFERKFLRQVVVINPFAKE